MAKSVVKEIIIMLLLCLAIIIVLGLLLYDYVPMSKVVPEPVSYTTPEEVQQELKEAGSVDESQVIMTYEVDSTDLNNYKNIKNYKPGKANPFSSYEKEVETNTTTSGKGTSANASSSESSTSGQTTNNGTSDSSTTQQNSTTTTDKTTTSEGEFFQDKGTK